MTDKQNTKSKNFWLISIFVSAFLLFVSGYAIYEKLNLQSSSSSQVLPGTVPELPEIKHSDLEDELIQQTKDKESNRKQNGAKGAMAQTAPESINTASKNPVTGNEKNASDEKKIKAVKTVFEYKNPKAKSVEIAGSFTKWEKRKMKKTGNIWKTELWILPGNYLYHFVVNGKKTLAPSKPKAPIGESILAVEPK